MNILWFGDRGCDQPALVGGKTANLSRLAAVQRVPPGFCLTTAAFDQTHACSQGEAATSLNRLPPVLCDQLAAAYRTLATRTAVAEPAVAVRSSAVDEDGAAGSFAGQHETYLNVIGIEAVAAAVVRCWTSATAPRALAYRRRQGLALDAPRLAVLVQQLVVADVSAVVFSADPLTGERDQVVITASWGVGESIVGGTVTPDTFIMHKSKLAVVSRQIAEKRRMVVLVPGGTLEVDVPRVLRTRPALDDTQLVEMAHLAAALETTMGWPVDVECAYQGRQLYLLQCRPITSGLHLIHTHGRNREN
jgi:pyruvate,water dikinase